MQSVAFGSALLALAVVLVGVTLLTPAYAGIGSLSLGGAALGSGVAYYLGFAPPRGCGARGRARVARVPQPRRRPAALARHSQRRPRVRERHGHLARRALGDIGLWDAAGNLLRFPAPGPRFLRQPARRPRLRHATRGVFRGRHPRRPGQRGRLPGAVGCADYRRHSSAGRSGRVRHSGARLRRHRPGAGAAARRPGGGDPGEPRAHRSGHPGAGARRGHAPEGRLPVGCGTRSEDAADHPGCSGAAPGTPRADATRLRPTCGVSSASSPRRGA